MTAPARLRLLTAGESRGPALVATLEGLPAGVPVTGRMVAAPLARRRLGYGRGARRTVERDDVTLLAGVRNGLSLGSPITVRAGTTEWPRWEKATAARVALGAVVRSFVREAAGIEIVSHVVELATARAPYGVYPTPADAEWLDADPVRCLDADASKAMVAEVDRAHRDGHALGGVVEVLAYGVPVGLGSHGPADRRLDARLSGALRGIRAVEGVEVGAGFALAGGPGARAHDESGATAAGPRRSGGTEGAPSAGEPLRVRVAVKPVATVPRALATVDAATGRAAAAHHRRSDVCAVPAAGIVAEATVALVLADVLLERFGGDSVAETRRKVRSSLEHPSVPWSAVRSCAG